MAEAATATEGDVVVDPPAPAPAEPVTGKTFTQEELNAIVQDRLARAAKGQPSKDELAELQAKAAQHDAAAAANQTELEKANAAREKAEAKADAALQTANDRLLKSSAVTALVAAGVTSVEAAYRALDKTGLAIADDGEVSGLEDAIKALLEEVPAFVGKGSAGSSADQGARGGGPDLITREQLSKMSPGDVHRALKAGELDHLTSG